ncbi:MysB family protein [Martelella alba]|uniref:SecY/secA suppressor protein n=1 Tax=Martelella alba TaxID=2590451 RepID=A0ABY2SPS3_9HYPH|nr:MysB family protein [Martelella alba]TKI07682.1 secY/secA suppressor protein [Martelella alba]
MSMYATLEEAIDTAREEFIETSDDGDNEDQEWMVNQFSLQKYVMQDGEILWEAEFLADENEAADALPFRTGEAAQAIFDGDYDESELRREWLEENTLHEWDEGDFQYEPPLDTEEGQTAADEWQER